MNVIYATYNIHHNSIDVYTYAGYFLRKIALNCGNFNSPKFGGIKSLQNLCSLFFQNRHLMYGNLVKLY